MLTMPASARVRYSPASVTPLPFESCQTPKLAKAASAAVSRPSPSLS
jgi:hypothetical protein